MSNSETSPDEGFEREAGQIETGRFAPGRAAMWLLAKLLLRLVQNGRLTIYDPSGEAWHFGPGGEPAVSVRLTDRPLPAQLLANPSLALGEAYMDGTLRIESGSLRDLLSICTSDMDAIEASPGVRLIRWLDAFMARRLHHNPISRSHANVAHHYDISTELYDLFLDADRQYSCAYFPTGNETLDEAQALKKKHIAAKLLLRPGMEVLDIGSGWGGLAMEFAQLHGARVTGLSLSTEQIAAARDRAAQSGLSGRVTFEQRDYREERGQYNRVVSVGMFEHVGRSGFDAFFATLQRVLRPDGVALVHAIGTKAPRGGSDPWIRKYIFPGGYLPTLSETIAAAERSGMWVTDVEVLRLHYAETLRHWSERFAAERETARMLYDERFCRMWEFYLAVCEMAFRNGRLMVFQIQLAKRRDAVPLTRDYIAKVEAGESAWDISTGTEFNRGR
ncbi:cyclopropane-fatty-acyl-phospholipid synthase family protein [Seohaeicola saemankumensis]|jgi:cyclopropane-fatty-acyl-phospholipid synthase|uniref:SAM-dependent methyltransferase n=1 Tax=Seohaeicola saemankumensis TaxID=481181 RepID=UPI001E63651C|nr:cyclopropane-fatty-acyl-phospholipid synthase family protein [Seohaeicola saemankumensis]MCD1627727.1 cyclopropane-fatty-acyl-phospholipid synthase family protein [Seohaeicola saemankumensis]